MCSWYENTVVKTVQAQRVILELDPAIKACAGLNPVSRDDDFTFDLVLDCRGLGGKQFYEDLRGVRGELIWLQAPEVNIQHPIRLLHPRYSLYIAPRPHHIYIIGASEIESENLSAISVRTLLELLSTLYYLHSGFSEAKVVKTAVHCRPTLASFRPQIKFKPGLLTVNGLSRHGFLLAPALANDILNFVDSGISAVKHSQLWSRL